MPGSCWLWSPKFPIPRGCFPEHKWPESQRIACPVSRVPFPRGCPESKRISGPIPRGKVLRFPVDNWFDSRFPIRNILWETGHAILWDSDHLSYGKHPLGIGF